MRVLVLVLNFLMSHFVQAYTMINTQEISNLETLTTPKTDAYDIDFPTTPAPMACSSHSDGVHVWDLDLQLEGDYRRRIRDPQ